MASADSAGKSKLYSLKSIYVLDQGLRIQDQYGQMLYTVVSVFDSMKPVSQKHKNDLGMAWHTPPLKKAKKQGETHYPASVPSL